MSDEELLNKIKTREELYARGYEWLVCEQCKGIGWIDRHTLTEYSKITTCHWCQGKGGHWRRPIVTK